MKKSFTMFAATMMCAATFQASAFQGTGTADDPYQVSTPADFAEMAAGVTTDGYADKYFEMTRDIDFAGATFTQIGTYSSSAPIAFMGNFNGNHHKISNLTVNGNGVFGMLANNTVKDIEFDATCSLSASSDNAGMLAGYIQYSTVSGIKSQASVTSTNAYVGGIVGRTTANDQQYTAIRNCEISGATVSGTKYVGGIVGNANAAATEKYVAMEVTGCKVASDVVVSCSDASSGGCGGVVGMGRYAAVKDCEFAGTVNGTVYVGGMVGYNLLGACYCSNDVVTNTAVINATSTSITSASVGGIMGCANGDANYGTIIENCKVYGKIAATKNVAGGIMGSYTLGKNLQITNCEFAGEVTANQTAGGISGTICAGTSIENCVSNGKVSVNTYGAGGINGTTSGTPTATTPITIKGCVNHSTVTAGTYQAAGISASTTSYTTIEGCYNTGTITANQTNTVGSGHAAGIVANASILSSYNNISVIDCFNVGTITSSAKYAAGIVAYSAGAISITGCYNRGEVTSATYAGGIAAQLTSASSTVDYCYNAGPVAATTPDYAGNITGGTGAAVVSNSVYLDILPACTKDNANNAVSVEGLTNANMGDDYESVGSYCFPVIYSMTEEDAALANAAAVVPAGEGETLDNITTNSIHVGTCDGEVSWSSNTGDFVVEGNEGRFTSSVDGEVILTATCGDFSRDWKVVAHINDPVTAITDIKTDAAHTIKGRFNMAGQRVDENAKGLIIVDGKKTMVK